MPTQSLLFHYRQDPEYLNANTLYKYINEDYTQCDSEQVVRR